MEFCQIIDETTSSQKIGCRTHMCPIAVFLSTGGFKFRLFQNACMVYKHAAVAAFHIHAQRGEGRLKAMP